MIALFISAWSNRANLRKVEIFMDEKIKRWVQTWQRAGKALAEEKERDLQSPTYYADQIEGWNAMVCWALEQQKEERTTSGLVEMQQVLKKIHDHEQDPLSAV
jgi:hypothetical protein